MQVKQVIWINLLAFNTARLYHVEVGRKTDDEGRSGVRRDGLGRDRLVLPDTQFFGGAGGDSAENGKKWWRKYEKVMAQMVVMLARDIRFDPSGRD